MILKVKHVLKSVVREIRTLRSVGVGAPIRWPLLPGADRVTGRPTSILSHRLTVLDFFVNLLQTLNWPNNLAKVPKFPTTIDQASKKRGI